MVNYDITRKEHSKNLSNESFSFIFVETTESDLFVKHRNNMSFRQMQTETRLEDNQKDRRNKNSMLKFLCRRFYQF